MISNISRKSAVVLPNSKDCLISLDGAKYFYIMGLASGYHRIPMKKEDKRKTAVYTRRGMMQYTVTPLGLTGASSTFENLIEKVMRGLQWETYVLYLDDVIVMAMISQTHTKTYWKSLKDCNRSILSCMFLSVSFFKNRWSS